jgi:AcrR family transcriptional regulator
MARTRSENYDGIHLGILTNAARLFSAQGYMRASIADLADACKLSRGALYHYFDSKEAILFAILDAHIREMIQHVETAVAAGGPTLTQFQNVIRAIVEVNAKSPHEQRVLIHDLSFLNEDEQRIIKDLERQLVDIVTDLLLNQLYLHLVRSEGWDRPAGIRRYGGRIVPARVRAGGSCESRRIEPA